MDQLRRHIPAYLLSATPPPGQNRLPWLGSPAHLYRPLRLSPARRQRADVRLPRNRVRECVYSCVARRAPHPLLGRRRCVGRRTRQLRAVMLGPPHGI